MSFDLCPICDGSGERDGFSGARCRECNGLGMIEDKDPDEEEYDDHVSPDDQKREITWCNICFDFVCTCQATQQKRNDAMERGDELRDRAKDER